jgi:CRP-like cAMP-binding protein
MQNKPAQAFYRNRVLAALPRVDLDRLLPHLSPVSLRRNQRLHEAGSMVDTVYFLEDGVCSTVVTMTSGRSVEVGSVGRDGFVGVSAVLGTGTSTNSSFMQIPGHGYKVKARTLVEQAEESRDLRLCLLRSVQGQYMQTAQTAACNRIHELGERLARWLLMCHDRVQAEHLPITQEFLAMMLGTRRSSVTVAAGEFQKAGLISHARGNVKVIDRAGLIAAACECYQIVHREFVRLGLIEP